MANAYKFSDEALEERFVDHLELGQRFATRMTSDLNAQISVSERRLYLTIISAYEDIARYKNYHLEKPFKQKSDGIKRASYLAKWICRFKPLNVNEGASGNLASLDVDKTTIINELFALNVAATHLSVDAKIDFVISEQKGYELAYEMLFRYLNEDSYLMVFQMLKDHVKGEKDLVLRF